MNIFIIATLVGLAVARPQLHKRNAWNDECGESRYGDAGAPFIINGKDARFGEFPWQVSLRGRSGSAGSAFCGGSIISSRWVVTAAHCTEGESASSLTVVVGEHDTREDNNRRIVHKVSKIINHPDYDSWTINQDISLLKMSSAIEFNQDVRAVCAPDVDVDYSGARSQVSGWGNVRNDGWWQEALILQWTDVEVISTSECRRYLDVTKYMHCAADFDNERDSCQGDSGGPLTVKDSDGYFRLAGIVSWGYGCAGPEPGVYTKVQEYVSWVSDTMNAN